MLKIDYFLTSIKYWAKCVKHLFAIFRRIVETQIAIQGFQLDHIIIGQLESKDIKVFGKSFQIGSLRNDGKTTFITKTKNDLSRCHTFKVKKIYIIHS